MALRDILEMLGRSSPGWLWGPVVAYMVAIFVVSGMPEPPSAPGIDDKTGHFLAYGGLALVTLRATSRASLRGLGSRAMLVAWAIATAYGLTDEFHQRFVPGRSADWLDWRADALGAALAVLVAGGVGIIVRSRLHAGARPPSP